MTFRQRESIYKIVCFRSSTANSSKEMTVTEIEPAEKREQLDAKTNTTQNMVRKK